MPLIDKNKEQRWFILGGGFGIGMDTCCLSTKVLQLGDLDTLNDKVYFEVLTSEEPILTDWELDGYIREDSSRVYYRPVTWTSEALIYDFNVKVSSLVTIIYASSIMELADTIHFTVTKIDTIVLKGEKRRCITLKFPYSNREEMWIEGIGSMQGLTYSGLYISGGFKSLTCYTENSTTIYKNPNYSFCFYTPTGINKNNKNIGFSVYPNPTEGKVTVKCPGTATFMFYDTQGALLFKQTIANFHILDVSAYPAGLYFYTIRQDNSSYYGKIILKH